MKKLVLCGFTAIVSSMLCAQEDPLDQIKTESEVVVLDQVLVDSWYGFGACYQMWQGIKNWTGFSRSDHVKVSDESTSKEALLAEVTEGTVCLLDDLIVQYKAASTSPEYSEEERLEAAFYVEDLQRDHDNLLEDQPSLISDSEIELSPVSSEEPVFIDENNLDVIPVE